MPGSQVVRRCTVNTDTVGSSPTRAARRSPINSAGDDRVCIHNQGIQCICGQHANGQVSEATGKNVKLVETKTLTYSSWALYATWFPSREVSKPPSPLFLTTTSKQV